MKPERWQQISTVFQAALERGPGQQAAFLDEACVGDSSLREEVESLIASHHQGGDFIEAPAIEIAAPLLVNDQGDSMVGRMIGHHKILSPLGEGGMGEVYLAQDTRLRRQIAIKLLPTYLTHDKDRLHRFEQEAHSASTLSHPNVCVIHEIGETEDGRHFITMEYVDGVTLRQHMTDTQMMLGEVLDVAGQSAAALAAAHAAGIVHRDIKPENIMIRRDGYIKVLDFGLAKLTERPASIDPEAETRALARTSPGMVMGTVHYMSPEQARGLSVDERTDIWSLGVVLYEMAAGHVPFEGETTTDVILSVVEREPPPLARYSREVPPELEGIVNKSLRKNKEERYQTVKDLASDLKGLKRQLNEGTPISLPGTPIARPASSAEHIVSGIMSHKRSKVLALATLVIAATAIAYFFYFAKGGEAIDSVAVLPFVNVSGDPNTEYLSDGLSDSIINSLSQLPNLKVIALNSVLPYKGRQIDAQAVGRELNVRAVLMSRLSQRADDLLISTELIDVRDNRRLWGEQYTRKVSDILVLQGEISRDISEELRLRLTGEERGQLAKHYTENIEAYQAYLQGHYYSQKRTDAGIKKGIEYFEEAIKIDPSYAPAYAGLARAYYSHRENFVRLPQESQQKIESALLKAVELDSNLAEAHALLGAIRQDQGNWLAAEKELKRAIGLNANAFGVHWFYARYLTAIGRNDEALAEAKRWLEVDPLSPIAIATAGFISLNARQFDQAIEFYRKAIEMDPNYAPAHTNLARAYVQKEMYEEAIAAFQKAMAIENSAPGRIAAFAYTYAVSGKRAEAQKMLAELNERSKHEPIAPLSFAIIYAGLGEKDRAFEWLEKAYQDRSGPPYLTIDLMLDSLRSDRRFADLARRKGLAA